MFCALQYGSDYRQSPRDVAHPVTKNKADDNHSHRVSFCNCLLRIPGRLNSNYIQLNDSHRSRLKQKSKLSNPGMAIDLVLYLY
jgi:hypothetical protein